eukprot:CAMPEP_0179201048 /NCGR_PEP_ID=MMETSP0796-20121207/100058_1 /TAXON_ID=73915 /ORGANISM="Pyrodinium bahamense, Strain pbaha01" /LENGTH=666 /DNA_ID=CAMNT_0020905605 /DNA_START=66 /DNA_END=2066 /DNA_ORIENTATION=+
MDTTLHPSPPDLDPKDIIVRVGSSDPWPHEGATQPVPPEVRPTDEAAHSSPRDFSDSLPLEVSAHASAADLWPSDMAVHSSPPDLWDLFPTRVASQAIVLHSRATDAAPPDGLQDLWDMDFAMHVGALGQPVATAAAARPGAPELQRESRGTLDAPVQHVGAPELRRLRQAPPRSGRPSTQGEPHFPDEPRVQAAALSAGGGTWPPLSAIAVEAPRTSVDGQAPGRSSPVRSLKREAGLAQRKKGEHQQPAGVKSKLSVHYEEGEQPMSELLRLAGGQGMDVIVEAVAPGSKAERAGVKPGFALSAMNGRNEFMQLPGWQVRLLLEAPITLGFDPEPVPPQSTKCTEIRLTRAQETLGIPPRVAVFGPKDTGVLAEEVVFNQTSAPLWLSAWSEENLGEAPDVGARNPGPQLYELRRQEAHAIVGHAIRGACDTVEQSSLAFEAEWFASAASRAPARSPSPTSLCSMDCVAECLENEIVFGADGRPVGQKPNRRLLEKSPARGIGDAGGTSRELRSRATCQQSRTTASGDRSPLRWLAPVLDRVWGQSPSPSPRGSGGAGADAGARAGNPFAGSPRRGPLPGRARGSSPKPLGSKGDNDAVAEHDPPGSSSNAWVFDDKLEVPAQEGSPQQGSGSNALVFDGSLGLQAQEGGAQRSAHWSVRSDVI